MWIHQVGAESQVARNMAGLHDMTRHADRQADILFPIEPFWFVPMHLGGNQANVAAVVALSSPDYGDGRGGSHRRRYDSS